VGEMQKSKTQTERELLHSLAISCYRAEQGDLMKCQAVKSSVQRLENYIFKNPHSASFDDKFCQRTGNINEHFSLHVNCHGKANVYRKTHQVIHNISEVQHA
jgi:hypothetical protein